MNLNLLQSLCGFWVLLAQNMAYIHGGGCLQCALALLSFQYWLTESERRPKSPCFPCPLHRLPSPLPCPSCRPCRRPSFRQIQMLSLPYVEVDGRGSSQWQIGHYIDVAVLIRQWLSIFLFPTSISYSPFLLVPQYPAQYKAATMSSDKITRIAIVDSNRCKPKRCAQECKKVSAWVVRHRAMFDVRWRVYSHVQ